MPKRKRSVQYELDQKLSDIQQELFRALKSAKGFERQRLSKRVHAERAPDKVQRLEREIGVLKALDLQQTAQAHLSSSLLKIKSIANHPELPDGIKQGAPKPELNEEERVALHNVSSGLYNRQNVRDVIDKAVKAVCAGLDMPVPDKKKKGKNADILQERDEPRGKAQNSQEDAFRARNNPSAGDAPDESDSFEGFSDDEVARPNHDDMDEDQEEAAMKKYETLLGNSDDEDEPEDVNDLRAKYGALLKAGPNTEDISDEGDDDDLADLDMDEVNLGSSDDGSSGDVSGEDEDDEDDTSDDEDGETGHKAKGKTKRAIPEPRFAPSVSRSPSPPPQKAVKRSKDASSGKLGATTFLPSLMGGYVSGSESASDLDLAPPKKRLGQRQRQAIAERKHGDKAKHLSKQAQQQKKGRDNGWDLRRGAVGGDEQGGQKGRKPWKQGSTPGGGRGGDRSRDQGQSRQNGQKGGGKPEVQRAKDDQGTLHPSWQARKKEKDAMGTAAFQGTKITF